MTLCESGVLRQCEGTRAGHPGWFWRRHLLLIGGFIALCVLDGPAADKSCPKRILDGVVTDGDLNDLVKELDG